MSLPVMLGVGFAIVALGLRVPPSFERAAGTSVALMLVALGALQIKRSDKPHEDERGLSVRPVAAGIVHGLAGSAGLALLALATISSASGAVLYLAAFAVGTVGGMAVSTTLLSWPLSLVRRAPSSISRAIKQLSGGASALLGAALLIEAIVGD